MTLPEYNAAFPGIPGLELPSTFNGIDVLNFGPLFRPEGGVQELLPPLHGPSYSVLVPRPRPDGDGAAGINTIWTRAPLGTNGMEHPRRFSRPGFVQPQWDIHPVRHDAGRADRRW